jgi:hypothetical protein
MARRRIKTYHIARRLRLIRVGQDDYVVLVQAGRDVDLQAGRICRIRRQSLANAAWLWAITGPAEPGCGASLLGEATDLEAAKSSIGVAFTVLMDWCDSNRDGFVQWTIR